VFEPQHKIFLVSLIAQALESPTETPVKERPDGTTGTRSPQHCKDPEAVTAQVVFRPESILDALEKEVFASGTLLEVKTPDCPALESP
jgi:hypothetical protein